jgi:hypothetical protein
VSPAASTVTTLPPCASCDPARCDHALSWWCADCDRGEDCGNRCADDASPGATKGGEMTRDTRTRTTARREGERRPLDAILVELREVVAETAAPPGTQHREARR